MQVNNKSSFLFVHYEKDYGQTASLNFSLILYNNRVFSFKSLDFYLLRYSSLVEELLSM